jgi:hypothetical protein
MLYWRVVAGVPGGVSISLVYKIGCVCPKPLTPLMKHSPRHIGSAQRSAFKTARFPRSLDNRTESPELPRSTDGAPCKKYPLYFNRSGGVQTALFLLFLLLLRNMVNSTFNVSLVYAAQISTPAIKTLHHFEPVYLYAVTNSAGPRVRHGDPPIKTGLLFLLTRLNLSSTIMPTFGYTLTAEEGATAFGDEIKGRNGSSILDVLARLQLLPSLKFFSPHHRNVAQTSRIRICARYREVCRLGYNYRI